MANVQVANNAAGTIAAGSAIIASSVATSLTLTTGQGAAFPAVTTASGNWFYITIFNLASTMEVCKVTDRTGDVLTLLRGQDGTTAYAGFAALDYVELRPVAGVINDLKTDTAAALAAAAAAQATANAPTWASISTKPTTLGGYNVSYADALFASVTAGAANTAYALATGNNYQGNSLGVGTPASGTAGEIRATQNITAYYSDERLKDIIGPIKAPLQKLRLLSGVSYTANDVAAKYGYTDQSLQVGVIAQEVQQVVPEAIKPAPFDRAFTEDGIEYSISGEEYLTVQYDRLIPLLIEAIKALDHQVQLLKAGRK